VRTQRRYGLPIVDSRILGAVSILPKWLHNGCPALSPHHGARRRDPAARSDIDEALGPYAGRNEPDHPVEIFGDKIPKTHSAPLQVAV
jgi:hypothetical protein